MANSPRDNFVHWLRDAHAMEVGTLDDLQMMVKRLDAYPQLKARIEKHIEETQGQEQRLKELLAGMNEGPSALKQAVTKVTGSVQAMVGTLFSDEVLKNAIASFAFEHFEIANYRALIVAAETAGEERAAQVLRQNLREEEAMAQWMDQHLPDITRQYLSLDAAGKG